MQPNDPAQHKAPHKIKVDNALSVTQVGERTIFTVHRHPIGLLGVYIASGILIIAMSIIAFVTVPGANNSTASALATVVFFIVSVLGAGFAFIVTKIYWGNSWVLTTDSVTQVAQTSLFNRQSSQLSLGNLEDISAEQNGILPHLFNYGILKVETAGEKSKFQFNYCPNPNYYAQQVLAAREAFMQGHPDFHEGRGEQPDTGTSQTTPSFLDPNTVPPVQPVQSEAPQPGAYQPPAVPQYPAPPDYTPPSNNQQ